MVDAVDDPCRCPRTPRSPDVAEVTDAGLRRRRRRTTSAEADDDETPEAAEPLDPQAPAPPELVELADAFGVATEFWDWQGVHVPVRTSTVLGVLAALDVPLVTPDDVRAALDAVRERPWRQVLPDVVVTREGTAPQVAVHAPAQSKVAVWIDTEDGGRRDLDEPAGTGRSHTVDRVGVEELTVDLPDDLPLGWHTLVARCGDDETQRPLVVTPERVPLPAALQDGRAWGFMTQLYSVRSRDSWGLGDLADLAELASWSAREHGAGFVLVNPLHAAEPVPPMEPSPYLPTTRRFVNPIYVRVEDVRETGYLTAADRAIVEWQAEAMKALNDDPARARPRRGLVGQAGRAVDGVRGAAQPGPAGLVRGVRARARARGSSTSRRGARSPSATGCRAPTGRRTSRDPRSLTVEHMRHELADRVEFHMWLQWVLDEQLVAARRRSPRTPGCRSASSTTSRSACTRTAPTRGRCGDALARDVTVGAPPDAFNQQGQDWSQPPWRPDRLAGAGLRALPRHAAHRAAARRRAARRPRHRAVPAVVGAAAGTGRREGTYVRYDHEALVGILALEAHARRRVRRRRGPRHRRAVGARLPARARHPRHVDPVVREGRRRAGRCRREAWRELCLATVTTHDLPPTAGYLAGEHIDIRERLGLLTRPVEEEARRRRGRPRRRAGRPAATSGCSARRRRSATRSRRCTGSWR